MLQLLSITSNIASNCHTNNTIKHHSTVSWCCTTHTIQRRGETRHPSDVSPHPPRAHMLQTLLSLPRQHQHQPTHSDPLFTLSNS